MLGSEYDNLKIDPRLAQKINHSKSYIKKGSGISAERNIFSNVELDAYEKQELTVLDQDLNIRNIYLQGLIQDPGKRLKFLYANQFNTADASEAIESYINFISDPQLGSLNRDAQKILNEGWIYIYGRDMQYRPIICINAHKVDLSQVQLDDIYSAIIRVFLIAETYMFMPGYIENWVIIVETNKINLNQEFIEVLNNIASISRNYFPNNTEKIYILNYSTSMKQLESELKKLCEQYVIHFIKKKRKTQFQIQDIKMITYNVPRQLYVWIPSHMIQKQLTLIIYPEELESRHGGQQQEPIRYWPPSLRDQSQQRRIPSRSNLDNISQRSGNSKGSRGSRRSSQQGKTQINANKYVPNNFDSHPYMNKMGGDNRIKDKPFEKKTDVYDLEGSIHSKMKSERLYTQQSGKQQDKEQDLYKEDLESRKKLQDEGIGACIII